MEKTITGGAAFPDPGRAQSAKQRETLTETGMTLRDYFAARALSALVGHPDTFAVMLDSAKEKGQEGAAYTAATAYELADAMLAARGAA